MRGIRSAFVLLLLFTGVWVASAVGPPWQRESPARPTDERAGPEALERRLAVTDSRLEALGREFASLTALLREREARLDAMAARVRGLEQDVRAGERVLSDSANGVALIQATVRYEDATGRPLRYRRAETRRPWRGVLGPPSVGVDGDGAVVTTTFLGTGFLVGRDGTVVTSRHVARPWETEAELDGLRKLGVEPRLAELRAFFPALTQPVPLTPLRVSDASDVMVLRASLRPGSVPVLSLDPGPVVPGRAVLLLGYPAGLELLLARIEPTVLRTLVGDEVEEIADDTVNVPDLLSKLARRGLIRPHASWGHVVDARPHLITYDARTAMGGSGGPVLTAAGRVIGVNQAVLSDFDAVGLGIPIRHALTLLRGRPLPP